jgi:AraC family transcriptional regulator
MSRFKEARLGQEAVMGEFDPDVTSSRVEISRSDVVRRHVASWSGIKADSIQVIRREPYEYRYKAPCHMLIMSERQERDDGETVIEGLPKSSLRLMNQKLTFVPAGHEFYGWQVPRTLSRYTYFYFDPHHLQADQDLRSGETEIMPRLFFFDRDLWQTSQKLKAQAENPDGAYRGYAEALGLVLAHEMLRVNNGVAPAVPSARGGLAGWQSKKVAEYIEAYLADDLSLSKLAEVAGLSPFHFARAFKESIGLPPLHYVSSRRIERAKELLAQPDLSVTQIGAQLGFADSSSFSASFRKHTGATPSAYRRGLE